jgi:hypothetical protein
MEIARMNISHEVGIRYDIKNLEDVGMRKLLPQIKRRRVGGWRDRNNNLSECNLHERCFRRAVDV